MKNSKMVNYKISKKKTEKKIVKCQRAKFQIKKSQMTKCLP